MQQGRRSTFGGRGLFTKELQGMLYANGDVESPKTDTVNALEDVLVDYLADLCAEAQSVSTNKGKVKLDDLRFALRHPYQEKQLARVEELLEAQREIAKARQVDQPASQLAKQFDTAGNSLGGDVDEEEPTSKRRKKSDKPKKHKGKERQG